MTTYQANVLNPKADRLLKDLADLELISLSETSADPFLMVVNRLRNNACAAPPTLEEITEEVEAVRYRRSG
ncbi:hypothetical protein [Persicitalea sp.]|uniref:hypothetical protein n=1 Tax=Persicitalea sp. TaxID=3100273 RepID=UPI0035942CB9